MTMLLLLLFRIIFSLNVCVYLVLFWVVVVAVAATTFATVVVAIAGYIYARERIKRANERAGEGRKNAI